MIRIYQGDDHDFTDEEVPEVWMLEVMREIYHAAKSTATDDLKDVAEFLEKFLVEAQLLESMFRNYEQIAAKVDFIPFIISQVDSLDETALMQMLEKAIGDTSEPYALITNYPSLD